MCRQSQIRSYRPLRTGTATYGAKPQPEYRYCMVTIGLAHRHPIFRAYATTKIIPSVIITSIILLISELSQMKHSLVYMS
jgi:hypothetical protein